MLPVTASETKQRTHGCSHTTSHTAAIGQLPTQVDTLTLRTPQFFITYGLIAIASSSGVLAMERPERCDAKPAITSLKLQTCPADFIGTKPYAVRLRADVKGPGNNPHATMALERIGNGVTCEGSHESGKAYEGSGGDLRRFSALASPRQEWWKGEVFAASEEQEVRVSASSMTPAGFAGGDSSSSVNENNRRLAANKHRSQTGIVPREGRRLAVGRWKQERA